MTLRKKNSEGREDGGIRNHLTSNLMICTFNPTNTKISLILTNKEQFILSNSTYPHKRSEILMNFLNVQRMKLSYRTFHFLNFLVREVSNMKDAVKIFIKEVSLSKRSDTYHSFLISAPHLTKSETFSMKIYTGVPDILFSKYFR